MVGWVASIPVIFTWAYLTFQPALEYFGGLVVISFLISLVIGYPFCLLVEKKLRGYGKYPGYLESSLLGVGYGIFALLLVFIPIFTIAAPVMLLGYFPATIAAGIQGGVTAGLIRRQLGASE